MRYPGGKGGCYRQIINLIPPHEVYIETHLGGGAVIRNKKPARRNIGIEADPAVLAKWPAGQYSHVEIVQGDAVQFLKQATLRGNEFVYSDPPYLPATRRRPRVYRHDYNESDHIELIRVLRSLPCYVALSGYDSDLYNDLLPDWTKVNFSAASHTGVRCESLWMNYAPPSIGHDLRFLGDSYREREQIKRRHTRLQSRIERLSDAERNLLGAWLVDRFPDALPATRANP